MFTRKLKSLCTGVALGATVLVAGAASAEDIKAPETPAEHEALAKTYQEKAASYREEAEWHKAMAAAYAKAHPDGKGGMKNPWNAKMQKHCQQLARSAEKLASEAEKAADFHNHRAREAQGK